MEKQYFKGLFGQENLKKQLSFYIQGQRSSGVAPTILFNSRRGTGKTTFATSYAKNLIDSATGRPKVLLSLNASGIKSPSQFVSDVYTPFCSSGQSVTIMIDEIHEASKSLVNALLTILQPNKNHINYFNDGGATVTFDFRNISWVFCTTHLNKIPYSKPFSDRCVISQFEEYTEDDLGKILVSNLEGARVDKDILSNIVPTLRHNPRQACRTATNINLYCKSKGKNLFDAPDWESLRKTLNILPYGVFPLELQELRALENGAKTLTVIGSKLGLDATSVRMDTENYLLEQDLISIDGKRSLTTKGRLLLKEVNGA